MNYLFIPLKKNGQRLKTLGGNTRIYRSYASAVRDLEHIDYDRMKIYAEEDTVSKSDFEKMYYEVYD